MFQQPTFSKRRQGSKKHSADGDADTPTTYPHRLNFYTQPPTKEITLEQFEQWASDRLRVLCEIESCLYRNKTYTELENTISPLLSRHLPLSASTSRSSALQEERQKDHYSHFILSLAFAQSEDLRSRFSKAESILFKIRFLSNDRLEKAKFVNSLGFKWETVSEDEKRAMQTSLLAATGLKTLDEQIFFKVDWESVSDLVEQRRVLLRAGIAYVPITEQLSLILAKFTACLSRNLEHTARAFPRLDGDDRLIPIFDSLSQSYMAPGYNSSTSPVTLNGSSVTAGSVDDLVQYMPMCMRHLHTTLRHEKLLKHFGRFQYGLFLKGIGLSVDEAINFWRQSFSLVTEERFQKDYRYNIRHSYGLEGTRRRDGYKPLSCQQILTDRPPHAGEAHGCPYRHFSVDNLIAGLRAMGVHDREVLRGVKGDVEATKFHVACNRVFEHVHAREIKREKDSELRNATLLDTILHPNEYFTRSFMLKNPGAMEGMVEHQVTMESGADPMM